MCYNNLRLFGGEGMKKLFMLFTLILLSLPLSIKAEEQEKVNIYLFKGDGCPHCADAETYFNSLSDEEKNKFNLVKYEVWYNETNKELLDKVAEKLEETVTGVPYIVVGEKTFSGFTDEIGEEIMNSVTEMYEGDSREDVVFELAEELHAEQTTGTSNPDSNEETDNKGETSTGKNENASKGDATIVTISILSVILAAGGLLMAARKRM